jgi:hypothetical protein
MQLTCHQPHEALDRNFVPSIVNLDVVSVEVELPVGVCVNGTGEGVPGVAGDVVGQHEDDLRIWDAEAFNCSVPGR